MKKSILSLSVLLLLLLGAFMYQSCNNDDQFNDVDETKATEEQKLEFDDFMEWGVIHNAFMTNIKNNFNPPKNISTYEEGVEYLLQFNISFLAAFDYSENEKTEMISLLSEYKYLIDQNYRKNHFEETFCSVSNKLRSEEALSKIDTEYNDLEKVYQLKIIDDFERISLTELTILVQRGNEGDLTYEELLTNLNRIKDEWEKQSYTRDGGKGETLAYVLSISFASAEWWIENAQEICEEAGEDYDPALVAPWVAADVGGAIVGGIGAGLNSNAGGNFSWESVGRGAVWGAVTSSAGAALKVGKWVVSLFK